MAKVLVNETSLSGIADAIRGKNGSTETYKPSEMAAAITAIETGSGGGDLPEEAFVITGNCEYRFANGGWDWFIENYENLLSTQNISSAERMFYGCGIDKIPFDINLAQGNVSCGYVFALSSLKQIPYIKGKLQSCGFLFNDCRYLKNIPDDWGDYIDLTYINNATNSIICSVFTNCYSLKHIPTSLLSKLWSLGTTNNYVPYYNQFTRCYVLNEVVNLPIQPATLTSNRFSSTFSHCYRLKNMTFAVQEEGTPCTAQWKSQVVDLSTNTGWSNEGTYAITNYNSGIDSDKCVINNEGYIALKDDPDWYAVNEKYSRYNHDSAVATINSLPDTSAYLATAGGTNTIKFKGSAGSATDGGAINTLTDAEIAVAAAKGWTVTLV